MHKALPVTFGRCQCFGGTNEVHDHHIGDRHQDEFSLTVRFGSVLHGRLPSSLVPKYVQARRFWSLPHWTSISGNLIRGTEIRPNL